MVRRVDHGGAADRDEEVLMYWDEMSEADYWENEILARQEREGAYVV